MRVTGGPESAVELAQPGKLNPELRVAARALDVASLSRRV